jgi:ribonuclease P protein component
MGEAPARPSAPAEGFPRTVRLTRRADYLRCYRQGGRRHGALAVVHFAPGEGGEARLGITASRKVGGAVVRQRLKRRVREVFRRWERRPRLPLIDVVVHLKPAAAQADFNNLRSELERLFGTLLPAAERGGRAS